MRRKIALETRGAAIQDFFAGKRGKPLSSSRLAVVSQSGTGHIVGPFGKGEGGGQTIVENLKILANAIGLGAFWFLSAYFAASFLPFPFPLYALNCAAFNLGLGVLAYAYLVSREQHKQGFLLGVVILFPWIYVTIGIIWILFRPIFDLIVKWLN